MNVELEMARMLAFHGKLQKIGMKLGELKVDNLSHAQLKRSILSLQKQYGKAKTERYGF